MKLFFVFLFSFFILNKAEAEKIQIVTENFPPFNYIENGKIAGLSTEVIQAVQDELGRKDEIKVYPWARAYKIATSEKNVLIFSINRIAKREKLFKWVGTIAPAYNYLYKLKSRADIRINSLADMPKYSIAAVREDSLLQYLEKFNPKSTTITTSAQFSLKLLLKGRVDLVPFDDVFLKAMTLESKDNLGLIEKAFFMKEVSKEVYMAFSKQTSDVLVRDFQKALKRIKEKGIYARILKKYMSK